MAAKRRATELYEKRNTYLAKFVHYKMHTLEMHTEATGGKKCEKIFNNFLAKRIVFVPLKLRGAIRTSCKLSKPVPSS